MRVLAVLFALLLVIVPTAAQNDALTDTRPPLLRVLSAAPDTPDIRNAGIIATFADYEAALALRGVEAPDSFGELAALNGAAQNALLRVLPAAQPSIFDGFASYLAEMPNAVGFDFFDIAQAAEIGVPPGNAFILSGEFDPQAVTDAHLARGYSAQTDEFGTTLCGAEGCENGDTTDFANRLPANPFGGNLGQSQPLTVNDSLILNTRLFPLLSSLSAAAQGRIPSLADAKDVQAVANILAYRGYVSAVILASPNIVDIMDATASSGRFSNFMGQLESLPPLPPYSLIAISHTADADYEYGDLLLIYPTIDSASLAYESITARLEVVESVRVQGRTIEQLLNEWGEFLPPQVVTDEKTNFSALQLTVRSSLETGEPARAFRALYQMLSVRDTVLFIPTQD